MRCAPISLMVLLTACPSSSDDGTRTAAAASGSPPAADTATPGPSSAPALSVSLPSGGSSARKVEFALGRMSPKRIGGLPDWALDKVHDCYTASLRTNPAQRGSLAFTVVPPAAAGNVEVDLKSEGSLQPDVVNCARGALQSIYHYPKGRRQPKLSATVTLEPELIQAPAPPTDKLARRLAAVRYAEAGVVEIVEYTTESIGHRSMLGDLVREMRYRLKLRFVRDGYEGLCVHHAQYKRFEVDPVKPRGAGHMCDSKPRKKGDETDDSGVHYFHLTDGGWRQAFSGGPLYCGDGVCR